MSKIKKTLAVTAMVSALVFSLVGFMQAVEVTKANFIPPPPDLPHIYIANNGSVIPPTAPIEQTGNTYTLKDNILNYSITVERSNIILDGANHTLQGNISNGIVAKGIYITGQNNIAIKNFNIEVFSYGIWISSSYGNTITENNITQTSDGIELICAYNNVIDENNIMGNGVGIYTYSERDAFSDNTITKNNIANNGDGIWLIDSYTIITQNNLTCNNNGIWIVGYQHNTITKNHISYNTRAIVLRERPTSNTITQNNFLQNNKVLYDEWPIPTVIPQTRNIWDGNFWSDYKGTDDNGDGFGDAPFNIDANNTDNHPLISPIELSPVLPKPLPISIPSPTPSPTSIQTTTSAPTSTPVPTPSSSQTQEPTPTPTLSPAPSNPPDTPKPAIPEFTVQFEESKAIKLIIKNQPFDANNSNHYTLVYDVRIRTNNGNWVSLYDAEDGYPLQSNSSYTTLLYALGMDAYNPRENYPLAPSTLVGTIPESGSVDFQVRAMIGYRDRGAYANGIMPYVFKGEYSDWSNIQTINISEASGSTTSSPSQEPTTNPTSTAIHSQPPPNYTSVVVILGVAAVTAVSTAFYDLRRAKKKALD